MTQAVVSVDASLGSVAEKIGKRHARSHCALLAAPAITMTTSCGPPLTHHPKRAPSGGHTRVLGQNICTVAVLGTMSYSSPLCCVLSICALLVCLAKNTSALITKKKKVKGKLTSCVTMLSAVCVHPMEPCHSLLLVLCTSFSCLALRHPVSLLRNFVSFYSLDGKAQSYRIDDAEGDCNDG